MATSRVSPGFMAARALLKSATEATTRFTDGVVDASGATTWVGFQDGNYISGSTNISRQLVVVRATADGKADATFGTAGVAALPQLNGQPVAGRAVANMANGQLLALGETRGSAPSLFLARYNANGTLDTAFGTSGIASLGALSTNDFTEMALQADGKLLLAGTAGGDFVLRRLLASGQPDVSYGTNSYLSVNEDADDQLKDVVLQPDGNAVAVGYAANGSGQNRRFAVLRAVATPLSASRSQRLDGSSVWALPNPTNGETVQVGMNWAQPVRGAVAVELLNTVGQVVARAQATGSGPAHYVASLPVANLPAGMYLLRASSGSGVLIGKVVVR